MIVSRLKHLKRPKPLERNMEVVALVPSGADCWDSGSQSLVGRVIEAGTVLAVTHWDERDRESGEPKEIMLSSGGIYWTLPLEKFLRDFRPFGWTPGGRYPGSRYFLCEKATAWPWKQ